MVEAVKYIEESYSTPDIEKDTIRWTEVSLNDVLERGMRLEASTFNIDRKYALKQLENSKYPIVVLDSVDTSLCKHICPQRYAPDLNSSDKG